MNYVRRAGHFVRKKIRSSHDRGHQRTVNNVASETSYSDHGVNSFNNDANIHISDQQNPVQFIHSDAVSCVKAVGETCSLSGGKDNIVALYNYDKKIVEAEWNGHTREVTKVLPGHDGSFFSASRDKTIRSWRACPTSDSSVSLRTYAGHELVVTAIDISRDYERFYSGSRDNSLKLWDVETASCVRSVSLSRNLVTDLKLGRDRPIIVQSSEDKELHLWDSRNLSVIQTFRKKLYIQTSCDLDQNDMYCISTSNGFGGYGCEATLWDLRAVEPVLEYRGHHETVCACAFIPSVGGQELVMTSSNDSTVRVWDKHSAACLACVCVTGAGPLTSIAAAPSSTFLVSSFNRGIVRLQMAEVNDQLKLRIIDVF